MSTEPELVERIERLEEALAPFAKFADPSGRKISFAAVATDGDRKITMGDCYEARRVLGHAALAVKPSGESAKRPRVHITDEMREAFELAIVTHNYLRYAEHYLPNNDIGLMTPEEIMEDWCEWIDRNRLRDSDATRSAETQSGSGPSGLASAGPKDIAQ